MLSRCLLVAVCLLPLGCSCYKSDQEPKVMPYKEHVHIEGASIDYDRYLIGHTGGGTAIWKVYKSNGSVWILTEYSKRFDGWTDSWQELSD